MPTLDELIIVQKHPNPFDQITYGNFWLEKPEFPTVDSIHRDQITTITQQLSTLQNDPYHRVRTVLLTGDAGAGKSNVLGRLKDQLNDRAYFAYIQPIQAKEFLWRHTLQYTFESLKEIPPRQQENQLSAWLKGLPILKEPGIKNKLLGNKKAFIGEMKSNYPTQIYDPNRFFGLLYHLSQPDTHSLACDWLQGYPQEEEDLKRLGVKSSIEDEMTAQGILTNFGRIANSTKPIILCFDQVERSLGDIFDLNTTFHNEKITNFLIIISVVNQNWRDYKPGMIQSDLDRITKSVNLDRITKEQAQQLWEARLQPLHKLADPKPDSPIAPLSLAKLPQGKINLRAALSIGGKLYEEYQSSKAGSNQESEQEKKEAKPPFPIRWEQEFNQIKTSINELKQFSDIEYLEMLMEVFRCLQINSINYKFLPGKNAANSFTYQCPSTGKKIGLIWQNNPNLTSLNALLKACNEVIKTGKIDSFYLIRTAGIGKSENQSYQLFNEIFQPVSTKYIHLKFTLDDVHYLRTYYKLHRDAESGDLIVQFNPLTVQELKQEMCEHRILSNCQLLQKLKVIPANKNIVEFVKKN